MKAEIEQILKMNKAGAITDEQAAELLAELAKKEPARERENPGPRDWDRSGFIDPFMSKMNDTVKYALDAAFGWKHSAEPGMGGAWNRNAEMGGHRRGMGGFAGAGRWGGHGFPGRGRFENDSDLNSVHMSRFDTPKGRDYVFTGNCLRMSSVRNLHLELAEMSGNTIDMSKVEDFQVRDGKVTGCDIRASSVQDWSLAGANANAVSILSSKVADFHCRAGSGLDNLRVQGSSIKDFSIIDGCKLAGMQINGCAIADVKLERTSISRSDFQASHVADVRLEDCEVKDLLVRLQSLRDTAFSACRLQDVVVSGSEKWMWKKMGFKGARFLHCDLEKVLFSNCRLTGVVLKNITLKDRQFRDLDLAGLTLDGNEAFLKAAGEVAA